MEARKSIKYNALMNAVLTVASLVFPLITFPYVSRVLGPQGTGAVSFSASIVSYFVMFAQLGIPTYGVRLCAQVRDDPDKLKKVVHELFIINLVCSFLSYIVFFSVVVWVPRLYDAKTLLIILSIQIILSNIGVEWLYKALEQYKYITIRSIFFKLIAVISTFLFIKHESDSTIYAIITIFASSASNILNFIHLRSLIKSGKCNKLDFRQHLKPIFVFFSMSCATTIYLNLDNVMLGFICNSEEVGYYNAAIKIRNILVCLVTSLGVVILPRVSYYYENNLKDEFINTTRKAMDIVFLLSIPLLTYFVLFSEEGIMFLSGPAYGRSIIPMQVLMFTLVFIGMTNVLGIQMLVPMGKEVSVLKSGIIGGIVNIIINIILIPIYGVVGAAVGTLTAEVVVWIVQYRELGLEAKKVYKSIKLTPIISVSLVSVSLTTFVKLLELSYFLKLAISFSLFALICYLSLMFMHKIPKLSILLRLNGH